MPRQKKAVRQELLFTEGLEGTANASATTTKGRVTSQGDEEEDMGNGHSNSTRGNAKTSAYLPLDSTLPVDPSTVYNNLWLFIWLKTIGSFDSGAFSAALGADNGIGNSWDLNMSLQGVLTSSVFLGNVLGCPLAGHLFSKYNEKNVLCGSLIIHTVFTFLFAAIPSYVIALVNRFFIGITLSFIVVYTPVWVDEFAPRNRQSVWMASHNAGVPLGIIFGYLLAAAPQLISEGIGWNWAFFIKCMLMVPTIAYVARVDSRSINTAKAVDVDAVDGAHSAADGGAGGREDGGEGRAGGADGSTNAATPVSAGTMNLIGVLTSARTSVKQALRTPVGDIPSMVLAAPAAVILPRMRHLTRGIVSTMSPLLTNVVYMCSVMSLTSLYFVATGLQNFVTQYLQEPPFNASMTTIMIGFGSAVVTAPVCGVIAGGILLDRIGGYKSNLRRVTLFLLAWGGCAVIFSVICIFARTTRMFLLVMSVVLFCGGALIPPGAGLTMASLPDHLRSTGAAFSQTLYNLLGNFSGPMVCGFVADATGRLRYGIITLLLSSAFGVVPLFGIVCVAFSDAPLANGLGAAASGRDGGTADTIVVEDASEMESVDAAGENDIGEAEADVHGAADVVTSALPVAAAEAARRLSGTPREEELPQTVAHGGGLESGALQHNSTPLAAAVPTAAAAVSPVSGTSPQPTPAHAVRASPLSSVVQHWDGGRSTLQGPGTVHATKVPSMPPLAGATHPAGAATETALLSTAATSHRVQETKADPELLRLEAEAAQIMSLPNQGPYGMDLVHSWLTAQSRDTNLSSPNVLHARNSVEGK